MSEEGLLVYYHREREREREEFRCKSRARDGGKGLREGEGKNMPDTQAWKH